MKVLYTFLSQGYDSLKPPKRKDPRWDYVCFTNDRALRSKEWDIVQVPHSFDVRRQSRQYKILSHEYFPSADQTIYVDATREVGSHIEDFASSKTTGLWLERHPSGRKCLYEEAELVRQRGLEDPKILDSQIGNYQAQGFPRNAGLYRGGVILRNKGCEDFNVWWDSEVINGSWRDQISLPYAIHKSGVELHTFLPGIVDAHFKLHLHEPRALTGGLVRVTERENIWSVKADQYIVWGDFPDAESAIEVNPTQHLITNGKGGMIFPRWLWNYLQFIDHLPDYIQIYNGKHLQWQPS